MGALLAFVSMFLGLFEVSRYSGAACPFFQLLGIIAISFGTYGGIILYTCEEETAVFWKYSAVVAIAIFSLMSGYILPIVFGLSCPLIP